ncbi:hypothetical protein MSTE_01813 [Mycobacteroides stephanolepidis]|uniref:Uncharacterized protein n=1 Tax=[Mycobacterium] stephanolepidis TaxID=1520670 RepID=A0A1Z4EW07_9MYCO|nr:hypothetical protein [[Mycobacterium] stephanolepidis]BAX97130.1 hypothetical protein MSTE_01813 [[Mycobacterium] stephanolepidis]
MNLRTLRNRPAAPKAPPSPVFSQAELRGRRRKHLPIHLGGSWSLSGEVREVCGPVAHEVSRLPRPSAVRKGVDGVADAVADVVAASAQLLLTSNAPDSTRQAAADILARPHVPEITAEQLSSGTWAHILATYADQVSTPLAKLLASAHPPGADALRGNPSASERIERALRGLDAAVLVLERALPRIAERQALPSISEFNAALRAQVDAERQARVERKLTGVPS